MKKSADWKGAVLEGLAGALAGGLAGGGVSGGIAAAMAPEGRRKEEFLRGALSGGAIGAGTGLLAGGIGGGLARGATNTFGDITKVLKAEKQLPTGKAMVEAWKILTPREKAAIIVPGVLVGIGGGTTAEVERRHFADMNKEGSDMLHTWLSKLAEDETLAHDTADLKKAMQEMTLDELDAILEMEKSGSVSSKIDAAGEKVERGVASVRSGVGRGAGALKGSFGEVGRGTTKIYKDVRSGIGEAIEQSRGAIGGAGSKVSKSFGGAVSAVKGGGQEIGTKASKAYSDVGKGAKSAISASKGAVSGVGRSAVKAYEDVSKGVRGAASTVGEGVGGVGHSARKAYGNVAGGAKGAVEKSMEAGKGVGQQAVKAYGGAKAGVTKTVSGIGHGVSGTAKKTGENFSDIRRNIEHKIKKAQDYVTDPALSPIDPRLVLAPTPTAEEHEAKLRAHAGDIGKITGGISGGVLGGAGGAALAHKLTSGLPAKASIPLTALGGLGGIGLGTAGGIGIGKGLGGLIGGHMAKSDTPDDIQELANVELAQRLHEQGDISVNELRAAEDRYNRHLAGELPKEASVRAFALKLAACSKTEKKSALKKVSGGTEYAGADSIKTAGYMGSGTVGLLGGSLLGGLGGGAAGGISEAAYAEPGSRSEAFWRGATRGAPVGVALGGLGGGAAGLLHAHGALGRQLAHQEMEHLGLLADIAGQKAVSKDLAVALEGGGVPTAGTIDAVRQAAEKRILESEAMKKARGAFGSAKTREAAGLIGGAVATPVAGAVAGARAGSKAGKRDKQMRQFEQLGYEAPTQEKTGSLALWVMQQAQLQKNAGLWDKLFRRGTEVVEGSLPGLETVAKKELSPLAKKVVDPVHVAEEAGVTGAAEHARKAEHARMMEGLRAMARRELRSGGGPGSMLTSAPAVEHMGAGRRSAMLR